jgi:CDGSH-type Zn-finger protein
VTIATVAELRAHLQWAIAAEHGTLPPIAMTCGRPPNKPLCDGTQREIEFGEP